MPDQAGLKLRLWDLVGKVEQRVDQLRRLSGNIEPGRLQAAPLRL
jgi:hypothetical protein